MPNVKLLDQNGKEQTYPSVDTVVLNTEGGTATFVSEHLIQNQVQADWAQTDDTQPDYIKNKPQSFESEPELPEVTSDDNGKVLGVADGVWQKITVSGASGSVQPDWNQNNPDASDYIKNRPFYDGGYTYQNIVPLTDVDFTFNSTLGAFAFMGGIGDDFVASWNDDWTDARVTWGDTTFTVSAQNVMGLKCLGNVDAFLGIGNNGIPFVITVDNLRLLSNDTAFVVASMVDQSETTRAIAVDIVVPNIIKIPGKYLSLPNWDQSDKTAANYIQNKPFYDYGMMDFDFINGDVVCGHLGNNMYMSIATTTQDIIDKWNQCNDPVTVVFDNEIYVCNKQEMDGSYVVGNTGILDDSVGTGEPFILTFVDDNGTLRQALYVRVSETPDTTDSITCNLHVYAKVHDIQKLPLKYHWVPDWNETDVQSGSFIHNKPFGKYNNGDIICDSDLKLIESEPQSDGSTLSIFSGSYHNLYLDAGTAVKLTAYTQLGNLSIDVVLSDTGLDGVMQAAIEYNGKSIICMFGDASYAESQGIESDGLVIISYADGVEITHIKIALAQDYVCKIPEEYLPDNLSGGSSESALPPVTAADNNKVLTVVDGVWAASTSANGLPNVTTSDAGKFLRVSADGMWVAEYIPNAEEAGF